MATLRSIAGRRAAATSRVERASAALASKYGVKLPEASATARDAELQRAMQLEQVAGLLERVAVATGAMTEEEIMPLTPEGNGPARPNEDGFDTQLPEGAKGAVKPGEEKKTAAGETGTEAEDLNELTVVELRERAKEAGVEGFSTMKKQELIDALGG